MHVKNRAKSKREREKERARAAAMSITQGRVNLVCYFPANAAVVLLSLRSSCSRSATLSEQTMISGCVSPVSAGSSVVATT